MNARKTKEPKEPGLADEIRSILTASTAAGEWLTAAQIYNRSKIAADMQQVHMAIHEFKGRAEILKQAEGERWAFQINPTYEPRRRGRQATPHEPPADAAPKAQVPAKPEATVANVPSVEPTSASDGQAAHPTKPAMAGFNYDLYDHLSHTLVDVEDLTGDALEHDAPKAVLRALLSAQGSLRRAQEMVIRGRPST